MSIKFPLTDIRKDIQDNWEIQEMKLEAKLEEENEPSFSVNADLTEDEENSVETKTSENNPTKPENKRFKKFLGV